MMKLFAAAVMVVAMALLLLVSSTSSMMVQAAGGEKSITPVTDALIRCGVCDRAIAHIWHSGVKLRTHCAVHGTDKRCDIQTF